MRVEEINKLLSKLGQSTAPENEALEKLNKMIGEWARVEKFVPPAPYIELEEKI